MGLPRNRRQEDLETEQGSRNELVSKSGVAWRQRAVLGGAGQSEGVSDQERGCLETKRSRAGGLRERRGQSERVSDQERGCLETDGRRT